MLLLKRYTRWLHTRWPAGTVEKLPLAAEDGSTNIPGVYIVGDLSGIPLLKFSSHTGARAVKTIVRDPAFQSRERTEGVHDLVIIGAGVSGMAAALEARKNDLEFDLIEASEPFSTLVNFPKGKPIYTYPTDMTPDGALQFPAEANVKERLIDDLKTATLDAGIQPTAGRAEHIERHGGLLEVHLAEGENLRAHRVIVGIGRSGSFRTLGVPGQTLDKVSNRLHDPKDFCEHDVLIVGGGDSALEAAIALARCGSRVTLSYRKATFSRPKPENVEHVQQLAADPASDVDVEHPVSERITTAAGPFSDVAHPTGSLRLLMGSSVREVRKDDVVVATSDGTVEVLPNQAVFAMLGRKAPLDFFRRGGIDIRGEWRVKSWLSFILFFAFCIFLYHWKSTSTMLGAWYKAHAWFPYSLSSAGVDPSSWLGVLMGAAKEPGFYYSLAYCTCVVLFGIRRIRRRRTPYITTQTLTLMAIQLVPLFVLPYLVFPWMGANGWFDGGMGKWFAATFFPDESYWRAFGFILAWPLFIWNVFTEQPVWGWLVLSMLQTFVVIPLIIWRWGKGAYCGWICSCGALAETLGDAHRHKMPHGPVWNRLNMVGQAVLLFAFVVLFLRVVGWIWPAGPFGQWVNETAYRWNLDRYRYLVDLWLAGVFGLGMYFHFSGRVWCRFACPLAALMHIYARFSQFRILSDKKKCISCNVCTSVCHQGIDIMNFANKGIPMEDPQCVRCSACVQSCPTGVLTFGRIDRKTGRVLSTDPLPASPVTMKEKRHPAQAAGFGIHPVPR